MGIKSFLGKVDRWFVYLLPWVCASSFFTKKHVLVACGAIALGRLLALKKVRKFFWADALVFLVLNAWLFLAAIRVDLFHVPLSESLSETVGWVHAIEFKRSFLIALGYFVCADTAIHELGLRKAFKCFAMTLGLSIILFIGFLLITEPKQLLNLYGPEWRLNYWVGWGFDDICGILGVWFFAMVALKRNGPTDWVFYCLGILLFLSLGRRPTVFFAGFLLIYLLKDIAILNIKSDFRRLVLWLGAVFFGLALALHFFGTNVVNFLKSTPVISRLQWTADGGWAQEGRFFLVQTFLNQYDFSDLFGGHINAAKIAGGLESFHNLIMDGFWYGGWIGGLCVIVGLAMMVIRTFRARSYVGFVMLLFIIAGLLVAAPPFSNQFAFALVLPLFLEYLRQVRSTKPALL